MENNKPYLSLVRMHNFQSWKESTTMQFKPGLNCIIGNNEVGKSVFFKILKLACSPTSFSKTKAMHLITDNEQYGKAVYVFSDFKALTFTFTRKYQFLYEYFPDARNPKNVERYSGQPPEIFLELLSIIKEPKSGFLANLIDSERQLLLVDSSAEDNYNLFELISRSEDLDRVLTYLQDVIPATSEQYKRVYTKSLELNRDLTNTKAVDENKLEKDILVAEKILHLIKILVKCNDHLKNIKITSTAYKLKQFFALVTMLNNLLQTSINKVRLPNEIPKEYQLICTLLNNLNTTNILGIHLLANSVPEEFQCFLEVFNKLTKYQNIQLPKSSIPKNVLSATQLLSKVQDTNILNAKALPNNYLCISKLLLDITKHLQGVNINLTKTQEYFAIKNIITLLITLTNVSANINNIKVLLQKHQTINNCITEYRNILDSLRSNNKVLSCPVHGQIVLVQDECVPVSEVEYE